MIDNASTCDELDWTGYIIYKYYMTRVTQYIQNKDEQEGFISS